MYYLDHAATTRVCPEAIEAAQKAMRDHWGNPSAVHGLGQEAEQALGHHRATVAEGLGCRPEELMFTSGGTEGNNWAIQNGAELGKGKGRHLITTAYEHDSVLRPFQWLEGRGYTVTYLQPNAQGEISLEELRDALRQDTILVSMMLVNNELGTILPIQEAVQLVRKGSPQALFHCDGVQGFFKLSFTPQKLGVDLLTISGHKIHGPKGVGALYVRKGLKWTPMIRGGGQERGMRSGTEATAQIAALAAAVERGSQRMERDLAWMRTLKEETLSQLQQTLPEVKRLGQGEAPHILALTLPGYPSEVVVRFLSDRGIYISAGSACHRGRPSHVYQVLHLPKRETMGAIRVSFAHDSTQEEVKALVKGLQAAKEQLVPSLS